MTLIELGDVMGMNVNGFVKRMYKGRTKSEGVRGRPPVWWVSSVDVYWIGASF